jgi:mannose-6-phosphate isomerase-like protein (cupin superfamily)
MKEIRTVQFDEELKIEAYRFEGVMQQFPMHFHDYYVIGFIERGRRFLQCRCREHLVEPGDLVLFNPGDNHACRQVGEEALDYRCLNIPAVRLEIAAAEITGQACTPLFSTSVLYRSDLAGPLRELHRLIMDRSRDLNKEELSTGFSDQSHFTNYFTKLIGLTPKQYALIFPQTEKSAAEKIST